MTDVKEGPEALEEERRRSEREAVLVNKLLRVSTQVPPAEPVELYMYLVNVSEGGFRVHMDVPFPEDQAFQLRFSLVNKNVEATVVPTWQKCLDGGTWTAGLELQDPTPETLEQVRALMSALSVQGRRERFRLRQLLAVTIRRAEEEDWCSVATMDVSTHGLRARSDESLGEGVDVEVKVFPNFIEVSARGRVVWEKEVGPSRYEFGVEFTEIDEEGIKILQRYIDEQT
jgi:hypothetical protein